MLCGEAGLCEMIRGQSSVLGKHLGHLSEQKYPKDSSTCHDILMEGGGQQQDS